MFCFAICDCNENKKSYDLQAVKTGHTKSCGCSKFNNPLIMEDLTGKFFGRLEVIARDIVRDKNKNTKSGNAHWLCQCSCGNRDLVSVGAYKLKSGETRSCGCLVSEMISERNRVYSPKENKTYKYKNNTEEVQNNLVRFWDEEMNNSFVVDKEDAEYINQWYWRKDKDRRDGTTEGYWITNAKKKDIENGYPTTLKLHQLIAERKYGKYDKNKLMPDHLSRDHDDNSRGNIELKSNIDNSHNRGLSITNKSGKTGVCFNKHKNKWIAYITVNYQSKYLGAYLNFKDAVNARIKAEKEYGFTCDNIKPNNYEKDVINNEYINIK